MTQEQSDQLQEIYNAIVPNKLEVVDITDLQSVSSSGSWTSVIYNVSSIFGYKNLTIDNFVFCISGISSWSVAGDGTRTGYSSYNPDTGIFKLESTYSNGSNHSFSVSIKKAYIIYTKTQVELL